MNEIRSYQIGRFYSLFELRSLASQLKWVSSRNTDDGVVHLYQEINTDYFWVGGPLQGPGTNFFFYLGRKERKIQTLKGLIELMKLALELSRDARSVYKVS